MNVLASRPIRALLAAQVVSVTGAQMTWLALPWFVLTTSGSATRTSLVMAAEAVGLAAFGLQGGNLVNRLGARRTMLLCDSLRAPVVALVPILHWSGSLSFPVLIAASGGSAPSALRTSPPSG
jgi:MFS family permease